MYSRLKVNSEKLYEVFMHFERRQGESQGKVIKYYPNSYNDEEVMNSSVKFAFPYSMPSRDHSSEYYTFVLTDIESKFKFGFCKLEVRVNLETCYCFVSFLPYFELFYQALEILANRIRLKNAHNHNTNVPGVDGDDDDDDDDVISTILLEKLHQATTFNPLDEICVVMLDFSQKFNFLCPSLEPIQSIPENKNISKLFTSFSVSNLMHLFASTIFERRILLYSKHLNKVTSCIHGLSVLIYPMIWQHLFIPILPPSLIDYCSAPMPYIIGLHTSTMKKLGSPEYSDAVIVNIDEDIIQSQHDDLKLIPQDVVSLLKKQLKHHRSSLDKNQPIGDGVSRAFLRAMAYLIGGYRNALRFKIGDPITFNRDAFISGVSQTRQGGPSSSSSSSLMMEYRGFFNNIIQTQLFQQFIQERLEMLNSGSGFQDDFEVEAMMIVKDDKWMTQSRYKEWMSHMKKQGKKIKKEGKVKWTDFSSKVKDKGKKTWKGMKSKMEDKRREDEFTQPYRNVVGRTMNNNNKQQLKKPPRPPPPIVSHEKTSHYNLLNFDDGNQNVNRQITKMTSSSSSSSSSSTIHRKSSFHDNSNSSFFKPLPKIDSNLLDEPDIQQCLKITTAFSPSLKIDNQLKKYYSLEGLCSSAAGGEGGGVIDDVTTDDGGGGDDDIRKINGCELEESGGGGGGVVMVTEGEKKVRGSLYRKSQSSFELDKLSPPTLIDLDFVDLDGKTKFNKNLGNANININITDDIDGVDDEDDDDDDDEDDDDDDDRFQITNFGLKPRTNPDNKLNVDNNNNIDDDSNNNKMLPKNTSFNDSLVYYSTIKKNTINKTSTLPLLSRTSAVLQEQQQQQQQSFSQQNLQQNLQHQQPQQPQQPQQQPDFSSGDLINFGSSDSSSVSVEFDPLKQSATSLNNNNSNNAALSDALLNKDQNVENKNQQIISAAEGNKNVANLEEPKAPLRPPRSRPTPKNKSTPFFSGPQIPLPQPLPRKRETAPNNYMHHSKHVHPPQNANDTTKDKVVVRDWIDGGVRDDGKIGDDGKMGGGSSDGVVISDNLVFDLCRLVNRDVPSAARIEKCNTNNNNNNGIDLITAATNDSNSLSCDNVALKNNNNATDTADINVNNNATRNHLDLITTSMTSTTTATSITSTKMLTSPPRRNRETLAQHIKEARTAFIQSECTIPMPPPGFDSFDPLSTGQLIIDSQSNSSVIVNGNQSRKPIFFSDSQSYASKSSTDQSRSDDQLLKDWDLLSFASTNQANTQNVAQPTSTSLLHPQQQNATFHYNKSMPNLVNQPQFFQQRQQQMFNKNGNNNNINKTLLTQQQLQRLYSQQIPQQQQQLRAARPNSTFYLKPRLAVYRTPSTPSAMQQPFNYINPASTTSSHTPYQINNLVRPPINFSPDFSPTPQKSSTLPHFTPTARFYGNFDEGVSDPNVSMGNLLFGAPSIEAKSIASKLCAMSNTSINSNNNNANNNNNNANNNFNITREWEKFD